MLTVSTPTTRIAGLRPASKDSIGSSHFSKWEVARATMSVKNATLSRWLSLLWVACACWAVAWADSSMFDGRTIEFETPMDAVRAKSLLSRGNLKIDPAIRTLVADARDLNAGQVAVRAKSLGLPLGDVARSSAVAVALSTDRGASINDLIDDAEDHGAEVTTVVGDVVFALVPVESLGLSEALYFMARQAEFRLQPPLRSAKRQRSASDGVRAIGADILHKRGITGAGAKVGILDFGFQRYSDLQANGLVPRAAAAKAFNNAGRIDVNSEHGTACAEIVHAVAPDAELYLAAVDGRTDQIIQAARWLADQGVDVISFSGGGHMGPHNGMSQLDRFVDSISQRGILWVNAAGNEGDNHWGGRSVDRNGDGWIDMGPNGENFIVIEPKAAGIALQVSWDDWGSDPSKPTATLDLDAYLFRYDRRTGRSSLVGRSANPQLGRGFPVEVISGSIPRGGGGPYLLALRSTNLDRETQIHVHSMAPAEVLPRVARGSIGIPATAGSALAVGAVDVATKTLQSYSSQGPTDDNRLKPEVSAPDNTASASYSKQGGRFPGTSAACPHVSGLAALLKQIDPGSSREDLLEQIKDSVRPMGTSSPNNEYGYGHIDASEIGTGESGTGRQQDGIVLDLPDHFGGPVSVGSLTSLIGEGLAVRESGRSPSLKIKVVVGRSEYRIGDGMKIGFTASEDCYYLLLGRDAQGNFTVISPLRGDAPRLRAGERRSLPEQGAIRVTGPVGRDEVLLLASRNRIRVENWRISAGRVVVARAAYRVVP